MSNRRVGLIGIMLTVALGWVMFGATAEAADVIAEVIEVLGEGRFEPPHAGMSTVGVALQPSISRVPDEVGREEGEGSIDSFRAEGLEGVSHDLRVLLRHRPRSIPQRQESA